MIVVADTSPINYLIQIECIELLSNLYGSILIPASVADELRDPGAPETVRSWIGAAPRWVEVRPVFVSNAFDLSHLDRGEVEAIQLAKAMHADVLLMDERRGCKAAEQLGLMTTGTLGVLQIAGLNGLIDAEATYRRLIAETNFRTSAQLERRFFGLSRKPLN